MNVVRSLCGVALALGLCTDAFANQPAPPPPDVCNPVRPGDTILDARIVSIEQPRYTCGKGSMQVRRERPLPGGPTAITGCILVLTYAVWVEDLELAETSPPLELDDSFRPYIRKPLLIELRIDGAPSTIRYVDSWKVCGLAPGHHVIEMDTVRGPLRCEGDVRAQEMLTLEATSFGARLHIEPMRLVAGAPLPLRRLIVDYDELNLAPLARPRPRLDDFPPSAILRVWKTPDGVLHAERCPSRPTEQPPAPRSVPASGCAHCSVGTGYRSQSLLATLFVLALVVMKRRR